MNDNGIMNGCLPITKPIREVLAGDIDKRNSLRESKLKIQKSFKTINGIVLRYSWVGDWCPLVKFISIG